MVASLFRETALSHYGTQTGIIINEIFFAFQSIFSSLKQYCTIFCPGQYLSTSLKGFPTHSWAVNLSKTKDQTQHHNFDLLCSTVSFKVFGQKAHLKYKHMP